MDTKRLELAVFLLNILIIAVAIACIVGMIFMASWGTKQIFKSENPPPPEEKPLPDKEFISASVSLGDTPDYGQAYINGIVFIGDSTVSQMASCDILSGGKETKQIWTGDGGTLALDFGIDASMIVYPETNEKMTVGDAAATKRPDHVIITLGINNGVSACNEEKFKAYYQKIIDAVKENSPTTKIILQSILPISDKKDRDSKTLSNQKIDEANEWIRALAYENGIRYLDSASVIKNSNGALDKKFDSGDGLHPNADGYGEILKYIRTHGHP